MSHSPTTAQWELAIRIRERRTELGIDTSSISNGLEFSKAYWSTIENNRAILAVDKFERLVDILELEGGERQSFIELYKQAREQRWWHEYADLLDEELLYVMGLESGASRIQSYEHQLITGLLQIPEYAQEVIRTGPANSPRSVRKRLELRRRRQDRVAGHDPVELTALMSEAALMQSFGDRSVLRKQLEFLLEIAVRSDARVDIRVIPFDHSPLGMTGSSTTTLFDFDSDHLPTVVWREAVTPLGIESDSEEVETIRVSFEQALSESSLNESESLSLIERRVDQLT